jgi:hypothetical protein
MGEYIYILKKMVSQKPKGNGAFLFVPVEHDSKST